MNASPVTVVRGGLVLPRPGAVPVRTDIAVRDGTVVATGDRLAGDREVDAAGCLVLPGFVQTHVHLCQTLFRGLAEDLGVMQWLDRWVWPLEQGLDEELMAASARWGVAQLLRSGTTTFLSMETARHTGVAFAAAADLGARAVIGKALMDRREAGTALLGETTAEARADLRQLVAAWHGADRGRIRAAVAPRAPSAATTELWVDVLQLARERDLVVHTHVNENRAQSELVAGDNGARDVEVLHRLGALGPRTVLAHCVWLSDGEVSHLADTGTTVAHCPSANLKLGSGIADVPRLLAAGVNIGLGTDGAACNNTLDVLQELRLAALVHRTRSGPGAMPADRALELATVNGARALGLGPLGGTIAVGSPADLVVLEAADVTSPGDESLVEPYVVHVATGAEVRTVLVAGRVVVEDHRLVHGDADQIGRDAVAARATLLTRTGVLDAVAPPR